MRHYYYSDNEKQLGPLTLDELKEKRIKKSTLVWTDGFTDWTTADKVDELKDIVISEPPPLPKKETTKQSDTVTFKQTVSPTVNVKYDSSYKKETNAITIGIIFFIISLALAVFQPFTFDDKKYYYEYRSITAIIILVYRIFVAVWVVDIAKRQNRDTTGWGWFAFFMPTLALIIIGLLRKLKLKIEIDGNLLKSEQALTLLLKANELYSENRLHETIQVINKVIELDNQNYEAILLRAKSVYQLEEYEEAKKEFHVLKEAEQFPGQVNLYLGIIESFNYNYDKAIKLWEIADENENAGALVFLDRYSTFKGKYFLNQNEINRKLGNELLIDNEEQNGQYLKYVNGIAQVDSIPQVERHKRLIILHHHGFCFKLSKLFKTYQFGINYTEINDIILEDTTLSFILYDNTIVNFQYDSKKDTARGLERIYKDFGEETGVEPQKTPTNNV